jgi:hypothetical protein
MAEQVAKLGRHIGRALVREPRPIPSPQNRPAAWINDAGSRVELAGIEPAIS